MSMQHHAYYIEGSLGEYEKLSVKGIYQKYERFGIDEARELIQTASLKNTSDTIYVVEASAITSEAQQALLKLFEEPQAGTTFILVSPHGTLLSTLKSRMLPFPNLKKKNKQHTFAKKFLAANAKERSASVAALLKDEEDQRGRVREFLQALELELVKNIKDPKAQEGLSDIAKVRSYVSDRSPSLKMLLEHLAISLPK